MDPRDSSLSLLWRVFVTGQQVHKLLGVAMAGSPLRADEYAVYSTLFDLGPKSPSELSRLLGMPPTTMSHYVRAMLERGHAERLRSSADGRSFTLSLTDAGLVVQREAGRHFETGNSAFRELLEVDEAFLEKALSEIGEAADVATLALGSRLRATA